MSKLKLFFAIALCFAMLSTTMLFAIELPEKSALMDREVLVPSYQSAKIVGKPHRDQYPDDFWGIRFKYSENGGAAWSDMMNAGDAGMWALDPEGATVPAFGLASLDFGSVIDADNCLHVMMVINEVSEEEGLNPLDRVNGLYHVLINTMDDDYTYTVIAEEGAGSFFYADAGIDGDGNLYVIWCNTVIGEEGPEAWEIWASKSVDHGVNWAEPFLVAGELELLYNFAHMTYNVGDYFFVIYQIPGEVGQTHNIAMVPAGLEGDVVTTVTGLESGHPYYSYKFGACNPIVQDVAAGWIYCTISDEDRGGIHIGLSAGGESWEFIHYAPVDEVLGPVARYPSLWLKADEELPYMFTNYGVGADYHKNCYTFDEIGYNGGSWIDPPILADSVLYEPELQEILYIHQGLWTPAGSWVRGTSVWGVAPILASMVTYWDDESGDWAARQRVVDIFADPPLDAATIADPTYLPGTEDNVWVIYTGMYGETDMTAPVCRTISLSSFMLEEDKVVAVEMTDNSGISVPMFNWAKDAEGYSWEWVEEADSMDTDPYGNGTYWFHLPDSVMYSDDDVTEMRVLVEGDIVYFYADAYDNNSNYGAEHNGDWENIWTVNVGWNDVESNTETAPVSFELGQNYPNPFNNETIIPFSLDRAANVNISIYNLSGRLVQTLYNGHTSAGDHTVAWRGDGNTSGIYFYVLEAAGQRQIAKLTLLR